MAYEEERVVQEWLDRLGGLRVETKKMFGCYCLYCDGQAVGWIHDGVLSLREVGLSYLPDDIKRPAEDDKIRELVIPLEYANAVWLPKAIQDTADIRKKTEVIPALNRIAPETGACARFSRVRIHLSKRHFHLFVPA